MVLDALKRSGLTAKESESVGASNEIEFLRYVVSKC